MPIAAIAITLAVTMSDASPRRGAPRRRRPRRKPSDGRGAGSVSPVDGAARTTALTTTATLPPVDPPTGFADLGVPPRVDDGLAAAGFAQPFKIQIEAIPVAMAVWFGAPLILFHDLRPLQAFRMSFTGCLRNILPFLLYGIVVFVLLILAMLPFLLGLLVLIPVGMASLYTSYRDIFAPGGA